MAPDIWVMEPEYGRVFSPWPRKSNRIVVKPACVRDTAIGLIKFDEPANPWAIKTKIPLDCSGFIILIGVPSILRSMVLIPFSALKSFEPEIIITEKKIADRSRLICLGIKFSLFVGCRERIF